MQTIPPETIRSAVDAFELEGECVEAIPCGQGHINDTFRITLANGSLHTRYTLQRINHHVFKSPPNVMENLVRVSAHLRKQLELGGCGDIDRRVLTFQKVRGSDRYFHHDAQGNYWRMYAFIEGASTIETNQTTQHIFQAAKGYGEFIGKLSDLPGPPLHELIANFHNGRARFEALEVAVEQNCCDRVRCAENEIDFIRQHAAILTDPQDQIDRGELPLRSTHNDTKISNVLLEDQTGEAVCVIDLDTVMPGLAMFDFGDLVRTTVTGAAEDEADLTKIVAKPDRFRAATEGFLTGIDGNLTPSEWESLKLAPAYMTLIMATRFLTDYLQGDTYYKIQHPEHNLQRTRSQNTQAESLLNQKSDFDAVMASFKAD